MKKRFLKMGGFIAVKLQIFMFDYESKRYKFHINETKANKNHGQTTENEKSRK